MAYACLTAVVHGGAPIECCTVSHITASCSVESHHLFVASCAHDAACRSWVHMVLMQDDGLTEAETSVLLDTFGKQPLDFYGALRCCAVLCLHLNGQLMLDMNVMSQRDLAGHLSISIRYQDYFHGSSHNRLWSVSSTRREIS